MDIWALWLDAIRGLLNILSSEIGLGVGLAIVAVTVLLRTMILPISWNSAYRGCIRHKKMSKLQPELQVLRERYADKPEAYVQHMTALYRKHGLSLFDGKSLLGALVQMPLFLGMFQALQSIGDGVRFLWVASLSKPDVWLSVIAGITTALAMAVSPDLPEQMRMLMIIVPSIIAVVAALNFCSALAVYWAVSNCFSAAQTVALHFVVERRIRSGVLRI
jgi:YidC/Oxa1 family membrane protein insertase